MLLKVANRESVMPEGVAEQYVPEDEDQRFYHGMASGIALALNFFRGSDFSDGEEIRANLACIEEVGAVAAARFTD